MIKKLRIGIVGIGNISGVHAQAIQASEKLELVSVFSSSKEKSNSFAEEYKINGYTNWEYFIYDTNLDAVSICTPNGTHLDFGEKAALAKKHVIIEKPIEVTLDRARKLITICKDNGVHLAIIYQNRFTDKISEIKRMIDNHEIGDIFMADAYVKWYRSQDYYDSGAWRGTHALDGGGVLINQAIHTIDLLQWLVGDVETIFGQTGTFTNVMEGEDNAVASLRFKNGAIGVIQASTSIQPAQSRRLEIHGKKGSILIDGDDIDIFIDGEKAKQKNKIDKEKKESSGSSSPLGGFSIVSHQNQFESISEAIQNNKNPPVTGKESMKSLAIVLAIYESSRTNAIVNLDDFINEVS